MAWLANWVVRLWKNIIIAFNTEARVWDQGPELISEIALTACIYRRTCAFKTCCVAR